MLEFGVSVCHCDGKVVQVSAKGVHHFIGEHRRVVGDAEFHSLFVHFGFLSCGGNTAKRVSLIPPNVGFAPVGDVDLLVRWFPEVPLAGGRGNLVPSLGFVELTVRRQHRTVGNGDKDIVTDGEGSAFRLLLCLIEHFDVLRDSLVLVVEFHHRRLNCDGVGFVEATIVGDKVREEL